MDNFFETMYFNGTIDESMFDKYNISNNTNSKGEAVLKSNNITMENHHCAKILTSNIQVSEHCKLIDTRQLKEYDVVKSQYDSEMVDAALNCLYESKFVQMVIKSNPNMLSQDDNVIDYDNVQSLLTQKLIKDNVSGVYKDELGAFVRVCSLHLVRRGKVCYLNVPGTKSKLVGCCNELKDASYSERLYPDCPIVSQLLESND